MLAPTGVAALLGIPNSWEFELDGGSLHQELVLHNKRLVGSVNAGVRRFEGAAETVASMPDELQDRLLTTVTTPENVDPTFEDGDDQRKAVVELGSP